MSTHVDYATVQVTFITQTDKAVLVDTDDLDEAVWVPKAALHHSAYQALRGAARGDEVEFRMALRTAEEKGLL